MMYGQMSRRAESRARYYIREQSARRQWNPNHVAAGGDFLEENEITAFFPKMGLKLKKPDFLLCYAGQPSVVVEAKNEAGKIKTAVAQAIGYADQINAAGHYEVKIAVGAAGEEDSGFLVEVHYLAPGGWTSLKSRGAELTTIPSQAEVKAALDENSGTTQVTIPASHEFIDAAIELSVILRTAKIEPWLRSRVVGSLVTAMSQGTIEIYPPNALSSVNELMRAAIRNSADISALKKESLVDALTLSGADFDRLAPSIGRIVAVLRRLNVRSVLQTDTDFLGMFYEAFLRYGYDNNALGVVFTPRHITRLCVELANVRANDRVIDIASGTGGFLVAAFDAMMAQATTPKMREQVKNSLSGFDTNPTVWALASLNMFFRGDGKSHIELGSSLEKESRAKVAGKFTRAFLNPPFSQRGEPERDFLDASMNALEPKGVLTAVVAAGIFADDDHRNWRAQFLKQHSLLAMINLPDDLFYPTAAPSSLLMARAHVPQNSASSVMLARISNDGFEKTKGRRVERSGSQLEEIKTAYRALQKGQPIESELATVVRGAAVKNGAEWSAQQHLPQPILGAAELEAEQSAVVKSIYQAVAQLPELADIATENFGANWTQQAALPLNFTARVDEFFTVGNGRSAGEKNYLDGALPYISSGDSFNSIVRLVDGDRSQIIDDAAITVTAFGRACVQPWPFLARGNGGSAVRVLRPKFALSVRELVWFAAQINAQKWRFFYARMAIKSRLERLLVCSPPEKLSATNDLAVNIRAFKASLDEYSRLE